jgi:hypothetical protein
MKTSCNIASKEFLAQIEAIDASDAGPWGKHQKYYPCKLFLIDGQIVERAICVEDHRGFTTDVWIHPDSVARVEPTKERLPAHLASQLYAAGESGMGYVIFELVMKDGSSHVFVTGNIVDYPDYPQGYDSDTVVSVYPHQGREKTINGYNKSRGCKWCYFVKK